MATKWRFPLTETVVALRDARGPATCPDCAGPLMVGGVGVHVSVYQGTGVNLTIQADVCLACGYRKAHQETMPVPDPRRVRVLG